MTDQTAKTVNQQNQETVTKQKNRKKEELKQFNEQITKQDAIEHKCKPDTNTYVYVRALSVFGLAISGYLLFGNPGRKFRQDPIGSCIL